MKKTLKTVAATAVVALGLGMGSAQAGPISGSISFSDGFDSFAAGSAIVSTLNTIDVQAAMSTFGSCAGDTAPCSAAGLSFDFGISPFVAGTTVYTIDGFTWILNSVSNIIRNAFTCTNGKCTDSLTFDWTGVVKHAGFDDTLWDGNWTGNGSCNSTNNTSCTGGKTGGWSSSLTALGVPRETPEPATLALLGLGLAGIGFAFRRKQA